MVILHELDGRTSFVITGHTTWGWGWHQGKASCHSLPLFCLKEETWQRCNWQTGLHISPNKKERHNLCVNWLHSNICLLSYYDTYCIILRLCRCASDCLHPGLSLSLWNSSLSSFRVSPSRSDKLFKSNGIILPLDYICYIKLKSLYLLMYYLQSLPWFLFSKIKEKILQNMSLWWEIRPHDVWDSSV